MSEAKTTQVKPEAKTTQVKPEAKRVIEVWQAIAECYRCDGDEWFESGPKTLCWACYGPKNCKVNKTYLND